jgi:hypothetical protein
MQMGEEIMAVIVDHRTGDNKTKSSHVNLERAADSCLRGAADRRQSLVLEIRSHRATHMIMKGWEVGVFNFCRVSLGCKMDGFAVYPLPNNLAQVLTRRDAGCVHSDRSVNVRTMVIDASPLAMGVAAFEFPQLAVSR